MLRSPLGRARGLGSARRGAEHWWIQRLTSAALVPLTLWFSVSVAALAGADHATFAAWVARPFNAVALLLLITAGFYHFKIGVDIVIEDYVRTHWLKTGLIVGIGFAVAAVGVASVLAVLKLAL
jgi:succinate dehydrogenase / fumarate reductase membrane anchor subunit